MSDGEAPATAAEETAGVEYWRERARTLGARAVVNLDHPEDADLDDVAADQRGLILPLLAAQLDGSESVVLDLGCGVGRFTDDLAGLVGGRAVGVDPTSELLALAPQTERTSYRRLVTDVLPLVDGEADVVFTSMVLGGIPEPALSATLAEVRRVLRPGGLVFLVESVGQPARAGATWTSRTVDAYRDLMPWASLREVGSYDDAGDPVVVLAGRSG